MRIYEALLGFDNVDLTTKQDTPSYLRVDIHGNIMGWNYTPWYDNQISMLASLQTYERDKEFYKKHIPKLVNFIVLCKWLEKAL